MRTIQRRQTIAPHCNGTLRLPVLSFFQMTDTREVELTGRDTNILTLMINVNAVVLQLQNDYLGNIYVSFAFYDGSNAYLGIKTDVLSVANIVSNGLNATIATAIAGEAASSSYTVLDIEWSSAVRVPAGFANAPQAAITDAPADAVTNYNVVTTLLGSLTSAVNTANTKQNQIATQLNSLLAELRTLGLITP